MRQIRAVLQDRQGTRRRRRVPAMSLVSAMPLACLIAGVVLAFPPVGRTPVLDDGTVWVTSASERTLSRFSVTNGEIDATLDVDEYREEFRPGESGDEFDVRQSAGTITLIMPDAVTVFDSATLTPIDRLPYDTGSRVMLGGITMATLDGDGELRTARMGGTEADPRFGEPVARLGRHGRAVVDRVGDVYAYRSDDETVLHAPVGSDAAVELYSVASDDDSGPIAPNMADMTVVGGRTVLLTAPTADGHRRLLVDGRTVDVTFGRHARLQCPPVDDEQHGWLAVADEYGLTLIDIDHPDSEPVSIETLDASEFARPISVGGCVYGAWNRESGNFIKACGYRRTAHGPAEPSTLETVTESSDLRFRTNGRLVVLNDITSGSVWDPTASPRPVPSPPTDDTAPVQDSSGTGEAAATADGMQYAGHCAPDAVPLHAVDDAFGERPGSTALLDVLRNDVRNDCSLPRVANVEDADELQAAPVMDGRYIQVRVPDHGDGWSLRYVVDDGRGVTSTATVTIRPATGNTPPHRIGAPERRHLERGGTCWWNVLSGFADDEGDPLMLLGATVVDAGGHEGTSAYASSDGRLTIVADDDATGTATVELVVGDGHDRATDRLTVEIVPPGTSAPTPDPVMVRGVVGQRLDVDLSPYVHGNAADAVRLSGARSDTAVVTHVDETGLRFAVRSDVPGTHYVSYRIGQNGRNGSGLVRVDLRGRDDGASHTAPTAVTDTAVLDSDGHVIVEPLANDAICSGDVPVITGFDVRNLDGADAVVVDNRMLHLSVRTMPAMPTAIGYTMACGRHAADGTIIVLPASPHRAPPTARDIRATVRTNGVVTVPVIAAAHHAADVALDPDIRWEPPGHAGLAFASGDAVRYQAGDRVGEYTMFYTLRDGDGNAATGRITVAVHASDTVDKPAPTPRDVTARTSAGDTVAIPIPLTGIDADGDDVTLGGLGDVSPRLGRVIAVAADRIVYEAYPDACGTDVFTYAVEDWIGQRAQATIRVGIAETCEAADVMATDDTVTVAPGTRVQVPVLDNDAADGDEPLALTDHSADEDITGIRVVDGRVAFDTPKRIGTWHLTYTVSTRSGMSDTGLLTITTTDDAPRPVPTARDYPVSPGDTIGKRTVDVDVRNHIADASAPPDELDVSVHPYASNHARIRNGRHGTVISITLADTPLAIPYVVRNAYGAQAIALVRVPAYGVFPPMLRPNLPRLTVSEGGWLDITLADVVRVGPGKTATLAGPESVRATGGEGIPVDDKTIRFVPASGHRGPAALTFKVSDDGSAPESAKPAARRAGDAAVLSLPITVLGSRDDTPSFRTATIDLPAGGAAVTISLPALTRTPDGGTPDPERYRYVPGDAGPMLSLDLDASGVLTISAKADAAPGSTWNLPIDILAGDSPGGPVRRAGLTFRITASNRPPARLAVRTIEAVAGRTTTVNVLADAYNPFPDTPLSLVDVVSSSPQIHASGDGGDITVMPSADAAIPSATITVTVQDATGRRERRISSAIPVRVVNRPDTPTLLAAEPSDGAIDLSWVAPNANGSPIDGYRALINGTVHPCGNGTDCRVTGLDNGRRYRCSVQARNAVGWSGSSNVIEASPDATPPAPANVTATGGYRNVVVTWDMPPFPGSAPDHYTVTLHGESLVRQQMARDGFSTTFALTDAETGTPYTATVRAHNAVGEGPPTTSAPATPWGIPDPPAVSATGDGNDPRTVTVTVAAGNTHGSGCSSIIVTGTLQDGTFADSLGCSESRVYIVDTIPDGWTIHAAVVPERPQVPHSSEAVAALVSIRPPDNPPTAPQTAYIPPRKEERHDRPTRR